MSMQRWAENVLETTKTHFQNVLESLSNLGGQKRVVLGNAQCLARQPSLALAELLKQKAGFQVQSQFWHHFVMVLTPYPVWRPTLYLDKTQVVQAPVGGHMGPLTHPHQVLPLLLHQTIMRPKTTFSFNWFWIFLVIFMHLFNGFPALTVTITITGRL